MSKRNSSGRKNRQSTAGKRTDSHKDAVARRKELAKRLNESPQTDDSQKSEPEPTPSEEAPPAKFQTAAVPVRKTAIKRAVPTKKTAVKNAQKKGNSFEIINKSSDSQPKRSAPLSEDDLTTPPAEEPEIVESSKISLKAPGARGPEEQDSEKSADAPLEPILQPKQEEPKVIKPAATQNPQKPKTTVPLRKETMRVSLKAPNASDARDPQPPPQEPVPVSKSSVPLRKETMRVSLKAPSADAPPPAEPVAPESPVDLPAPEVSAPQVTPEEQTYQPKEEKPVPVRKETIRVSLKAPVAVENDPMENPDILEPRKLSERPKEDPNQKYAPPGLQDAPAANLDQVLEPSPMLEPEPEPEPEPEQVPMSLDEALPLRKETMRVSVKAPFAGMAAAQAAAAREPILATQPSMPEPEPAPAVVLEQSTAAVGVVSPNAAPPPPRQKVQQTSSELNTPLMPAPIKPKKDLGSILMTWVCIILGIIAAVMIYLVFTS